MPFDPSGGVVKDLIYRALDKMYQFSSYGQMEAAMQELEDELKSKQLLDKSVQPILEFLKQIILSGKERDIKIDEILFILKDKAGSALSSLPDFPIFTIKLPRNPDFTGRVELLEQLHEQLNEGETTAVTQTVTGLGGVGKTQLALEYAHKHRDKYQLVSWLRAEDSKTIVDDLETLAGKLFPGKLFQKQPEAVAAVLDWLSRNDSWLLVYDNAEKPEAIKDFLPPGGRGHALITSRYRHWRGVAKTLEVSNFRREEAIAFIRKRTGIDDDESADKLADTLGDLPLALEQACAYIEQCKVTLPEYLALLNERQSELLDKYTPDSHEASVTKTFLPTIECIRKEEPAAIDLICLFAFFAPDYFPHPIIQIVAEKWPDVISEPLRSTAQDKVKFNEAVASILSFSLVEKEGDFLFIHRLVHAVIRETMPDDVKKQFASKAVNIMQGIIPDGGKPSDVRFWNIMRLLYPHALTAAEWGEKFEVELEHVAAIYNQLGNYSWGRAAYTEASRLYERSLKIKHKVYKSDDQSIAQALNNLGNVLQDMGDLAGAKEKYEQSLTIFEKVLGKDNPNIANLINNLGEVLREMGDFLGAKEKDEQALQIRREKLGEDHPDTAQSLNNLGLVLQAKGDTDGAKKNFEQALKIRLDKLGEDHPETAGSLNNLGSVLQEMGDLAGAKEKYEQGMLIYEKAFGKDHPHIATVCNNLAILLEQMGQLQEAKPLFERALNIRLRMLGPEHPYTIHSQKGLADLLRRLGED